MSKKLLLLVVAIVALGFVPSTSHALINLGFETGDLSNWTSNISGGAIDVVSSHTGSMGTNYDPAEGSFFARILGGAPNFYNTLSQSFNIGVDETIFGAAAYDHRDGTQFPDDMFVRVYDGGTLIATPYSNNGVGQAGIDAPWSNWSWTAPTAGDYLLVYGVRNTSDNLGSPYALFDAPFIENGGGNPNAIPEPATMLLLGSGLFGMAGLKKKRLIK